MGRGAGNEDISILPDKQSNEFVVANISADTKWSCHGSLVDDAISMRTEPDEWSGIENVKEILTFYEACERFHVNAEIFSKEPGCCFAEHMRDQDGEEFYETTEYSEEYDDNTGDYVVSGGYEPDFSITNPVV